MIKKPMLVVAVFGLMYPSMGAEQKTQSEN